MTSAPECKQESCPTAQRYKERATGVVYTSVHWGPCSLPSSAELSTGKSEPGGAPKVWRLKLHRKPNLVVTSPRASHPPPAET